MARRPLQSSNLAFAHSSNAVNSTKRFLAAIILRISARVGMHPSPFRRLRGFYWPRFPRVVYSLKHSCTRAYSSAFDDNIFLIYSIATNAYHWATIKRVALMRLTPCALILKAASYLNLASPILRLANSLILLYRRLLARRRSSAKLISLLCANDFHAVPTMFRCQTAIEFVKILFLFVFSYFKPICVSFDRFGAISCMRLLA
jgi:hypothetical protein